MVIPDGTDARRGWRVRWLYLQLAAGTLGGIILGIILFFFFYGHVVSEAALAKKLKVENDDLQRYRYKVKMLEENLTEARALVGKLTRMAGIDYQFPEMIDDSTLFSGMERRTPALLPRGANRDLTKPSGLPVQGFVTKDFEATAQEKLHPGVDIACAVGTPVLATGSGLVQFSGADTTYGQMVIIKHNDSVTTLYGHNDRLLVKTGEQVQAGSRIALSGNTGHSTAPHVHYEMRVNDKPINPLENPYDKETFQQ